MNNSQPILRSEDTMKKNYCFVVLTNAEEGRDEEYNDWYDNRHLVDVLKIPGIVSAQRFKLAPVQNSSEPSPHEYLALYQIETDDLKQVMDTLRERSGTEAMPRSDALSNSVYARVFEVLGEPKFE